MKFSIYIESHYINFSFIHCWQAFYTTEVYSIEYRYSDIEIIGT